MSAADLLVTLRDTFSERPDWHGFSPRQLALLLFLHGYTSEPAEDLDVGAALPFTLEDFQGVA